MARTIRQTNTRWFTAQQSQLDYRRQAPTGIIQSVPFRGTVGIPLGNPAAPGIDIDRLIFVGTGMHFLILRHLIDRDIRLRRAGRIGHDHLAGEVIDGIIIPPLSGNSKMIIRVSRIVGIVEDSLDHMTQGITTADPVIILGIRYSICSDYTLFYY